MGAHLELKFVNSNETVRKKLQLHLLRFPIKAHLNSLANICQAIEIQNMYML